MKEGCKQSSAKVRGVNKFTLLLNYYFIVKLTSGY